MLGVSISMMSNLSSGDCLNDVSILLFEYCCKFEWWFIKLARNVPEPTLGTNKDFVLVSFFNVFSSSSKFIRVLISLDVERILAKLGFSSFGEFGVQLPLKNWLYLLLGPEETWFKPSWLICGDKMSEVFSEKLWVFSSYIDVSCFNFSLVANGCSVLSIWRWLGSNVVDSVVKSALSIFGIRYNFWSLFSEFEQTSLSSMFCKFCEEWRGVWSDILIFASSGRDVFLALERSKTWWELLAKGFMRRIFFSINLT